MHEFHFLCVSYLFMSRFLFLPLVHRALPSAVNNAVSVSFSRPHYSGITSMDCQRTRMGLLALFSSFLRRNRWTWIIISHCKIWIRTRTMLLGRKYIKCSLFFLRQNNNILWRNWEFVYDAKWCWAMIIIIIIVSSFFFLLQNRWCGRRCVQCNFMKNDEN